jgi:large subunit ribosomal protein L21
MYAVIRAGGKQYRVAPGDVLRLETQAGNKDGKVEFGDVLAVSASAGEIVRPESGALVTGHILGDDRAKKILVFHYKRKKQYKKLAASRSLRCGSLKSHSTDKRSPRPSCRKR